MKPINENATDQEVVQAINDLIALTSALRQTLMSLNASAKFSEMDQKLCVLENKIIAQGDFFASHLENFK